MSNIHKLGHTIKSENWLVDKKYIFLTHSLTCLHSPRVSVKYARYAFFLLFHLSSTLAELKSTPNIIALIMCPNMCILLKKKKKYIKTSKDKTTITILQVTSEFV